jgi:hypothetical protein
LIVENFQIVRSEHMAAEGDPVAEISTNYVIIAFHYGSFITFVVLTEI